MKTQGATLLGVYTAGHYCVSVWTDPTAYGARCCCDGITWEPAKGAEPVRGINMMVGLASENLSDVVDGLIHESFEMACMLLGYRYEPAPTMGNGADNYLFVFDHRQLEEILGFVSLLFTDCSLDVQKAWRKAHQ